MQYEIKNIGSIIEVLERGNSFSKYEGFPICPLATSQIGNTLFKTSVIPTGYYGPDDPLENTF